MAKIKTRKHVDPQAVDKRLAQMDLKPGIVIREDVNAGEWEIETADLSISDRDLARVIADLPETQSVGGGRRAKLLELRDKAKWTPADNEAALRLLLDAEMERS